MARRKENPLLLCSGNRGEEEEGVGTFVPEIPARRRAVSLIPLQHIVSGKMTIVLSDRLFAFGEKKGSRNRRGGWSRICVKTHLHPICRQVMMDANKEEGIRYG
jgi:hypothetical protein